MQQIDEKDRQILQALQRDASMQAEALGDEIGLSATSVQRRVKRLVADRVLVRHSYVVAPEKLGFNMRCIVNVELEVEHADVLAQFRGQLDREPRVQQSYYVTGSADFVLIVLVRDMDDYESLTRRLFFGNRYVRRFTTNVVLNAQKVGLDVPTEEC